MTDLGDRIRHARREAHLFQHELAGAIGVHPDTIGNWELGYSEPTVSSLESIAARTHQPIIYFVAPEYLAILGVVGCLATMYNQLDKEVPR